MKKDGFDFQLLHQSSVSKSRRGRIASPHGSIETPAFVTVGTKATIKALPPVFLADTKTQFVFANTYHLVIYPGLEVIEKMGGIHNFCKINLPIITDSGGFQVFSLGGRSVEEKKEKGGKLVKISDEGVKFKSYWDGTEYFFTPEFSISAQQKIGADFIVAFDECAALDVSEKYLAASVARTHNWLLRSITKWKSTKNSSQKLYGVIQGGRSEKLRRLSTEFVANTDVFGIGLGGVAIGEESRELKEQVSWMCEVLDNDPRPRHLLGVSDWDQVLASVRLGVDTFDCILPTRDARLGLLYVHTHPDKLETMMRIDFDKTDYRFESGPIDKNCPCSTCKNFSISYLYHLYKQKELLYHTLATVHNLAMTERWFSLLRVAVENDQI